MKYFLFFIISLFSLTNFAQEHPIVHAKYERDIFQRFDNFTTKNGLPSNTIRRIFQDKEGFIWLATDNGLSRYDGNQFINFLPVKGDSSSISNHEVTSIAQTSDGYLWVGTKDGLNRLDTKTGHFQQFRTTNAPFVRDNYIRALLVCSDGYLWYDSVNATLTRLDPITLEFHHFARQDRVFTEYFNHALFETNDKKIWVGSYGSLLQQFNKKTNLLTRYTETTDKVYRGIDPAADGWDDQLEYLWIANFAHHATIINKKTNYKTPLLKHPGLNAIIGDRLGNVWFGGCYATLNKYDPKKNTVTYYEHDDNNPQSKLGGQIYSIMCDRTGVIWIGSDKGLSRLSPYKYKFPLYRTMPGFPSPKSNNIKTIFQDRDDDIWFGTGDSAVFYFNPTLKTYQNFKHIRDNPETIGSRDVTGIAQEKDGTLWFSLFTAWGGAINSLNKRNGTFKRFDTSDKYYWYSDLKIHNDTIIVGSWGTGVMYFDKKIGDYFKAFSSYSKGFTQNDWGIHRIAADKDGNIWYSSGVSGICTYSTIEDRFYSFIPQYGTTVSRFSSLLFNSFNSLRVPLYLGSGPFLFYRDKGGVVWEISSTTLSELNKSENKFLGYKIPEEINPMATCNSLKSNGFWLGGTNRILHFSTETRLFTEYKPDKPFEIIATITEIAENKLLVSNALGLFIASLEKKKQTISLHKVDSISFNVSCRLENGNVLLGGSKGLFIFNVKTNKIRKIEGGAENIVVYSIHSLTGDCIYIGSDNGLLSYDQNRGIINWWKADPNDKNKLNANIVYSVAQTPDGSVWLGTNMGYSKLNPDKKTFTNCKSNFKDALTSFLTSVVYADSKGYIWVGTTGSFGLSRIDNRSGIIENYQNQPLDSTSISNGDIADVFESADHTIWIGTEKGLCKFIPVSNSFTRYGQRNGFESIDIRSVKEDESGNLWLGTVAGITKFNPQTNQCTNYSWKDGVQPGAFNNKSAIRLKNGQLVFGGDEGYNMFYPEEICSNPIPPEPLITAIKINDILQYISDPKEIKLSYNERNLEFRFTSSDYNFPENNKLEYKLDGFDQAFKMTLQGTSAVYTNLKPGNYQFILRVTNNDGIWSSTPLTIPLEIAYPFWLYWWAIILEIAIMIGIIAQVIRINSRRIIAKNKDLEKEVYIQTERLYIKNEEIAAQHEIVANQKAHIQKLYDQLFDNIEYAKTIQRSLQLTKAHRDHILGDNIIVTLPQNQLSGDFVWVHHYHSNPVFIVADCMLNGIPGAILSMVYISILKEIFKSPSHCSPAKILKRIEYEIEGNETGTMHYKHLFSDIAIGVGILDRSKMEVTYAGKQIDLYICKQEDEKTFLFVCKGSLKPEDKFSKGNAYSDNICKVESGNFLYLFTDGLTKLFTTSQISTKGRINLDQLLIQISDNKTGIQENILLNQISDRKEICDSEDDITIIGIRV